MGAIAHLSSYYLGRATQPCTLPGRPWPTLPPIVKLGRGFLTSGRYWPVACTVSVTFRLWHGQKEAEGGLI